ncbi:MAG TPA: hypothetical protein VMD27_10210 [Candidatus Aquilonibacter sp.]|nr:hypothetical protein [Candidatus Aquilonibacter sp.]
MKRKIASLAATFKTTAAFGAKYAADFPATSTGGQQFALVSAAVPQTATLGAAQVSGTESAHAGVLSKVAGRFHLHDDLHRIADAAHSLVLMGTAGLQGKFLMPRSGGDQALLNAARAFQTDAPAFSAQFIGLGLDPNFITNLGTDITNFEAAISAKGAGTGAQAGATGGLEDAAHKAAIALHVLKTIVPNVYKNNPAKLAEWATASHVEKHTPTPRAKPAAAKE